MGTLQVVRLIVLVLLSGVVAAGGVWFGWQLFDNLAHVRRERRARVEAEAAQEDKDVY